MSDSSQTDEGDLMAGTDPFAALSPAHTLLFAASVVSTFSIDVRSRWDGLLAQGKTDEAMALLCERAMKELQEVVGGLMEAAGGKTFTIYLAKFGAVEHRFLGSVMKTGAAEEKKKRDRKPNPLIAERDREIVRLKDEGGLTYGQIARRINKQLQSGKRMNYRSVQAAYKRAKKEEKETN